MATETLAPDRVAILRAAAGGRVTVKGSKIYLGNRPCTHVANDMIQEGWLRMAPSGDQYMPTEDGEAYLRGRL